MATVSWQFFCEKRTWWMRIIGVLIIVIMGLSGLCFVLGVKAYENANSKEILQDKITTLQAKNEQQIKAWKEERAAFVEYYNYKGRLSQRHTKAVDIYDEKIKRIQYQNEGINLLEKQLSRP